MTPELYHHSLFRANHGAHAWQFEIWRGATLSPLFRSAWIAGLGQTPPDLAIWRERTSRGATAQARCNALPQAGNALHEPAGPRGCIACTGGQKCIARPGQRMRWPCDRVAGSGSAPIPLPTNQETNNRMRTRQIRLFVSHSSTTPYRTPRPPPCPPPPFGVQ